MFDTVQFYPTPRSLSLNMIKDINFKEITTVLEPSTGKCDLAEVVADKLKTYKNSYGNKQDYKKSIDCIEISKDLQSIIKDKGYRLVGDDFLTLHTYKHYDLIIMNPPFQDGEKHILKAISIAENNNGAKIRCILNAETLKNPYSNTRKLLLQKIEAHNGKIEYIENAFIDAERKTGVEIALVRLDIEKKNNSIILDALKKEEATQVIEDGNTSEVGETQDFISAICAQYNDEVAATVKLIKEYDALSKMMLKDFKDKSSPILELRINGDRSYSCDYELLNNTIKEIRYKYWNAFLMSDEMSRLMTSNIRTQWHEKLTELKEYDFSPFNARQVQFDVKMSLTKGIEETIITLFDEFTRYAMQDGSSNIHYFTGWKTNDAYKLGNKIIMPYMNAFDTWGNTLSYTVRDRLKDIEKVFIYIDSGVLQMDHVDMQKTLDMSFKYGETRDIELKYFSVSFFKKGTAHFKFDNKYKQVLDRFNYIACNLKGWLPNSFAKKQYSDMTQQEKNTVKTFCGSEETYNKEVMANQHLYNFNINDLKLIS